MLRETSSVVCAIAHLVAAVLAAPAAGGDAEPFAFGALDELASGSAWEYQVTVPRGNVTGGDGEASGDFPVGPPRWPQDCATRAVRLSVAQVAPVRNGRAVRLRVEDEGMDPMLAAMGPSEVELRAADGALSATVLRGGVPDEVGMRYEYGRVPIACYPPFRTPPATRGQKVLIARSGGDAVRAFQALPSSDGASVTVQVRDYRLRRGEPPGRARVSARWLEFYDEQANEIVVQPKADRELPIVSLDAYEIQSWDIGQPFPRRVRRYTADGILIMSCELVSGPDGPIPEREPAPPRPRPVRPWERKEPAPAE